MEDPIDPYLSEPTECNEDAVARSKNVDYRTDELINQSGLYVRDAHRARKNIERGLVELV